MNEILKQNMNTYAENFSDSSGMINFVEMMRVFAETVLNEIMSCQADDFVEEGNSRNGYRDRPLDTTLGKINLRIPKLRRGTFFPDNLLIRYSRTEKALAAAAREMVINGISTRKVDKVAQELGVLSMSKSQVSRIIQSLDDEVVRLTKRAYKDLKFPYLWLDATYLKCRHKGHVSSDAMVTAIAAGSDGYKHLVGFDVVDTESEESWKEFLISLRNRGIEGVICVVSELRNRGIEGVICVVSDAHEGLKKAIEQVYNGASWQRCIVHFMRNLIWKGTNKKQRKIIGGIISAVFKEDNPQVVREAYRQACIRISALNGEAGKLAEDAEIDVLAYLDFPEEHRKRLRTNNVQERLNREIKRRSNVIQVFPSRESCMRLVGAVLGEIEEKWLTRRWFSDKSIMEAYEVHTQEEKYDKKDIEERCELIIKLAEKKVIDNERWAA